MSTSGKLLVVADDPAAGPLRSCLSAAGYDVGVAAPPDAVDEAHQRPVDALLLLHSPTSDPLLCFATLRAAGCLAPAILLTARPDVGLLTWALRLGVRDWVAWPAEGPDELLAAVERVLPEPGAGQALRRSEQQLRQVWEQSLDAMRLTDAAGTLLRVNAAYCRLVGKPREELEGRCFSLGYAEPGRADALARHRDCFANRQSETLAQRRVALWDGREVHLEFSSSFLDVPGEPLLLLNIIRDLSPRVALEGQLRHAQKMEAVGRLAGGVAHDFNNLLTVINGFSELVYDQLDPAAPQRRLVAEIRKAGERAANLTRQLLAFSRKQILAPRLLDLNEVVADMGGLLRRLLGADIDLAVITDPALWLVEADPGGIEQVVVNLAVNARDAMPTGGQLTIETHNVHLDEHYARTHPDARPGPHVLVAVADTGCGMDAATLARAFEPFFTTKGEQGTGLGLATVYGVVKQSGGHVGVYSEPGRGTTFKVYLPRAVGVPPSGRTNHGLTLRPGIETVLLVEDEASIRELAQQVLQSCGYTVLVAGDGREALTVADQYAGPLDLLVTDVVMPHLSGGQLAGELGRRRPGLKVLYLSGYTDDAVVRHGVLEETVSFLHKPFTLAALTQKVREVLDASV